MLRIDDLAICFENLLMLLFCDMFLYRRWKQGMVFQLFILISWGFQYALNRFYGHSDLAYFILDFFIIAVFYKENWPISALMKKAFCALIYWGLVSGVQAIVINFFLRRCDITDFSTEELLMMPEFIIKPFSVYLLALFLCIVILERFRKVEQIPLSNLNWIKLLSMPIISWIFVTVLFPYNQRDIDRDTLSILTGFSILIIFLNLYVFHVYRCSVKSTHIHYRYLELQSFWAEQKEYFQSELNHQNKVRDLVHDVLHNISLVSTLLADGRIPSAQVFLQKWGKDFDQHRSQRYTGNWDIDAILTGQIMRMKEQGIRCTITGQLPEDMPFDVMDICRLLSNAISNAFEYCKAQAITGNVIDIDVTYTGRFFCFSISNPLEEDTNLAQRLISKKRAFNHGRGVKIIQSIVANYEGESKFSIQGGRFILEVILQAPFREKAKFITREEKK